MPLEIIALGDDRILGATNVELARRLGVSRFLITTMRERGVTPKMADQLACQQGLHPALIWASWYDEDSE